MNLTRKQAKLLLEADVHGVAGRHGLQWRRHEYLRERGLLNTQGELTDAGRVAVAAIRERQRVEPGWPFS